MITTTCGGCGRTLAVADEFAGRQARCPACGEIYTVPVSMGAASPIQTPAPSATHSPSAATNNLPGNLDLTTGYANPAPLDLGAPITPSVPSGSVSTGSPSASPPADSVAGSAGSSIQYWMKASNGAEYGPVDAATLGRWFTEGRVGPDYQIRIGQFGHWQPAAMFESVVTGPMNMNSGGVNPFAAVSTYRPAIATSRTYPKADQGGLVLAMGILAWIGFCPIFGIIAWVVGAQAIAEIKGGQSDPSSLGIVQVGYYLGMVNVIIFVLCGGLFMLGIIGQML